MEKVYITEMIKDSDSDDSKCMVRGAVDRDYAHEHGISHLTTIIVPFICAGDDAGLLIVQDRTTKLWATGEAVNFKYNYNFIGGHVKAEEDILSKEITFSLLQQGALDELHEELFDSRALTPLDIKLEIWEDGLGLGSGKVCPAIGRYSSQPLIPIGFAEYESEGFDKRGKRVKHNREHSYVFALPVHPEDFEFLISADDFKDEGGSTHHLMLQLEKISVAELFVICNMSGFRPDKEAEIADAIRRLWKKENKKTYENLISEIKKYIDRHGSSIARSAEHERFRLTPPPLRSPQTQDVSDNRSCTDCREYDKTGHDCYRTYCIYNSHKYGDVPYAYDMWS